MYKAHITRQQKTLFVFLIDRSGSMDEKVVFNGSNTTKAAAVAQAANLFIEELINRSYRDEGIRDYYDIAIVGYNDSNVTPLLCSSSSNFTSVSALARLPVNSESVLIKRISPNGETLMSSCERKQWISSIASGDTPMHAAFGYTEGILKKWCRRSENANSFPPIVINITDGEASDADFEIMKEVAQRIKNCSTNDGNVLLFNIHISSGNDNNKTLKFPSLDEELPYNRYTKFLFEISSTLPEFYNSIIEETKPLGSKPPYKAMCYNCLADSLIRVLSIGSVSINKIL